MFIFDINIFFFTSDNVKKSILEINNLFLMAAYGEISLVKI